MVGRLRLRRVGVRAEQGIRGHLTWDEAREAHETAGSQRLVIIHRPDELPLPEGVERASDGLEVDL